MNDYKILATMLWAAVSGLVNNLGNKAAVTGPVTFRRGTDLNAVLFCDPDHPGRVKFTTPTGEGRTEDLVEAEIGQLLVSYGTATGNRIELPPLMGYGGQAERAAGAAAVYPSGTGHP